MVEGPQSYCCWCCCADGETGSVGEGKPEVLRTTACAAASQSRLFGGRRCYGDVARKRASLNSVDVLEDWPGIACICLEVLSRRAPETAQIRNLAVEKVISIMKRG